MTGIDAAMPYDDDRRVLVEHKAQPTDPRLLACPSCNDRRGLIFIESAEIERDIDAAFDVGATDPEIEVAGYEEALILDPPAPKPVGVRCSNCRWGYRGPHPLARLVKVR